MKHPAIRKNKEQERIWGTRSWDERITQHFKAHELPNVAKQKVLDHEVYIGVSDEKMWDEMHAYPSGYFKTAYAIKRGKTFSIQVLEYDGNHDDNMTESARLQARVSRTIKEAMNSIELGLQGGFYEK